MLVRCYETFVTSPDAPFNVFILIVFMFFLITAIRIVLK